MSNANGFVNLPVGVYLNVRKQPNLYSDILTSLVPKTELNILQQNGEWYQIQYNNQIGYVFAEAVLATSEIKISGMTLNLEIPTVKNFEQPIFDWNALVTTKLIPIKNSAGEIQSGYDTSDGDHITIIKNDIENNLTFIQYPDQSGNCYQQGWIDSSYISPEYLDFRLEEGWVNNKENQIIYLFNNTLSDTILNKGAKYTLLYTVSNYNIEYSCILFEENNNLQIGFVLGNSGEVDFILKDYPYNIENEASIGTITPTVSTNAIVTKEINLIDANGIEPYYSMQKKKVIYPSIAANSRISVLEILCSAEENSLLIEYYNAGSNTYNKGYLPLESLINNEVILDSNPVIWNSNVENIKVVNLTNSQNLDIIGQGTEATLLYITSEYACIEFNYQSGYVSLDNISEESLETQKLNARLIELENKFNKFTNGKVKQNKNINSEIANINSEKEYFQTLTKNLQADINNNQEIENSLNQSIKSLKIDTGLIGGINLVESGTTNFGEEGLSSNAYGFGTGNATLIGGRNYTLTVCAEILQEAQENGQHFVIEMYTSDWSNCARIDIEATTATINQTTISVPETETYIINSYSYPQKIDSKNVRLYWYNVQEGEVGTSWVPSMYDLEQYLKAANEN